jgi:hypothetical protein
MASNDGTALKGWAAFCGIPATIAAFTAAPPLGVLALAATVAAYKIGDQQQRAADERAEAERIDQLEQECKNRGLLIAKWIVDIGCQERRWRKGEIDTGEFVAFVEKAWARYPKVTYPEWFVQFSDAYAAWYWEGEQLHSHRLHESDTASEDELEALWEKHADEDAAHAARRPALQVTNKRERDVLEKEALRCRWERGMAAAFHRYDEGNIDTADLEDEVLSRLPCSPT